MPRETGHRPPQNMPQEKGSDIIQSQRVRAATRTHDDYDRCEIFIGDIASTDETEEDACVHAVAPASSCAQWELDDTKSGLECVKEELKEMKKMLEFLVRRERKIDVKTEVAVKKLQRLEKSGTNRTTKAGRRQVVRRQELRLWQSPHRRDHLHPRLRSAWWRSAHDRHGRVGASRERRSPCRGGGGRSLSLSLSFFFLFFVFVFSFSFCRELKT